LSLELKHRSFRILRLQGKRIIGECFKAKGKSEKAKREYQITNTKEQIPDIKKQQIIISGNWV